MLGALRFGFHMRRDTYAFIYDDFLNDRKYERGLAALDARLASLDLVGRAARLTLFRSAKEIIESMVSQGSDTVVLVGNDQTLDKVMWFLPDLDVTLGYLPIDEPSRVAQILGIPKGEAACDVLAARLIETIDVGRLDERYFLTEVALEHTLAAVDVEGRYRISPSVGGSIFIRNLGSLAENGTASADAKDGYLEVVIRPEEEKNSRLFRRAAALETRVMLKTGEIVASQPIEARVDNHVMNSMRFKIGICPRKLKLITGRRRRLAPEGEGLPNAEKTANLPFTTVQMQKASTGGGIGIRTSLRG
jgi:hypothetical protein